MAVKAHYLVLEADGKQRYIFNSNKLRENVGASQIVHEVGTEFVRLAVEELNPDLAKAKHFDRAIGDAALNPPLEASSSPGIEVVVASSGKAEFLVKERAVAKALVADITLRALRSAPGLLVKGGISQPFEMEGRGVEQAVREAYRRMEEANAQYGFRFLRLPVVAECAYSGLPAAHVERLEGGAVTLLSNESLAKETKAEVGRARLGGLFPQGWHGAKDLNDIDRMLEDKRWVALVHADGNGLGQVFINFGDSAWRGRSPSARVYVDKLRRFSMALDECTKEAFRKAVEGAFSAGQVPLIPLVVAGDDLTVLCSGSKALHFTEAFLEEFEKATSSNEVIRGLLQRPIGICAGVAVFKPHYPFFNGYQLAEALLKNAKQVKNRVGQGREGGQELGLRCCAFDFHVLHDTVHMDLDGIRRKLTVDETTHLYSRPYLTSSFDEDGQSNWYSWYNKRRWQNLQGKINALTAKDEDGRHRLPSSQMHALREALSMGSTTADHLLTQVFPLYKDHGLKELVESEGPPSIFWEEEDQKKYTYFLDAMEVADLQGGPG